MKKRLVLRPLALLGAAGVLLAALTGCTAAPPSGSAGAAPAPAESTAPATEDTAALPAASPSPTPEPTRDPAGAAVFNYAQQEDAALRAQQYWYNEMTAGSQGRRYALVEIVAASVLRYEDCIYSEELMLVLAYAEQAEEKPMLDRIYEGEGMLVQVQFYTEYEPETYYLGPQYSDGAGYVYIFAPADAAQPCEYAGGRGTAQRGTLTLRPDQTAMVESLTMYQSRMLLHQCRAMAAAGLREFDTPKDWTEEELYRYLYCRAQDFDQDASQWEDAGTQGHYANMFLTIDFTGENDWSSNERFFAREWQGFTPEQIETYSAGLDSGAVPGYQGLDTAWQFDWDGDTLVATMQNDDGVPVQEYRFQTCEGFEPWNGRTYCVGARPLA